MTDELAQAYDVVVIGGGAAGLSAALILARSRRSVLVVDAGEPRNAPAAAVHGFLSRDGIRPAELAAIAQAEVRGYGGHLVAGRVDSASHSAKGLAVTMDDGRVVEGRRLLVATGLVDELPDIPGVRERWGETCCTARTATVGRLGISPSGSWRPVRWRATKPSCSASCPRT